MQCQLDDSHSTEYRQIRKSDLIIILQSETYSHHTHPYPNQYIDQHTEGHSIDRYKITNNNKWLQLNLRMETSTVSGSEPIKYSVFLLYYFYDIYMYKIKNYSQNYYVKKTFVRINALINLKRERGKIYFHNIKCYQNYLAKTNAKNIFNDVCFYTKRE